MKVFCEEADPMSNVFFYFILKLPELFIKINRHLSQFQSNRSSAFSSLESTTVEIIFSILWKSFSSMKGSFLPLESGLSS